ncbi:MAG TPA: hypothetical protein VKE26_07105 [Xanthobacteraceae bacterium]|nr:hypothetical protein [Xanthobacteraceae bacterium]
MSPDLLFWLALAVKMAITAGFVVLATATAERAGALVGALVATLPIAAGPAYVFLALDHDVPFIATSALASLAVNAVTAIFALTYAAAAQRHGLALSLAAALAAWTVLAAVVRSVEWTLVSAIGLNVVVIPACIVIGRRLRDVPMPLVTRRAYDIPLRAAMAAVLVATVVGLSARVGPTITGILAVFPIVLTSLMLILHPRIGGRPTAAVLTNTISGLGGFACALLALHLAAVPLGSPAALMLALAVSIAANLTIWAARRHGIPV